MKKHKLPQNWHTIASFLKFRRRQKITIATILITLGFIFVTQTINILFQRYYFILGLAIFSYIISLWAIWEQINWQRAIVVFILPTFFILASTGFYFLLPIQWITRLPIVILFGVANYALLLSQNVFNVAASRAIPLYRAASTVSLIFTLITTFFLFNVIFALDLPFYWNLIVVFLICAPLFLQSFWTVDLGDISGRIILPSLIASLVVAEMAMALSFWPLAPTIWALFLSTTFYILLGILLDYFKQRLTYKQVLEFGGVGIVVLLFSTLITSWNG